MLAQRRFMKVKKTLWCINKWINCFILSLLIQILLADRLEATFRDSFSNGIIFYKNGDKASF